MGIIKPLPRSIALTQLKTNLFLLFLFTLVRTIFTPYTTVRGGIIWLIDDKVGAGGAGSLFSIAEWVVSALIGFNVIEAAHNIYFPSGASAPKTQIGRVFIPSKPSSPLTRPSPRISAASRPAQSTSTPSKPQTQLMQTNQTNQPNALSTPTRSPLARTSTPGSRSSPLSSSTAKLLNLPQQLTPSKTGLYFDSGEPEQSQAPGGEFVMVDREEREWVDNVWKGVRGKGGRVNL